MSPSRPPAGRTPPDDERRVPRPAVWIVAAVATVVALLIVGTLLSEPPGDAVTYQEFRERVEAGQVATVTARENSLTGELTEAAGSGRFRTERPAFARDDLTATLEDEGVALEVLPADSGGSSLLDLVTFLPMILILGLLFMMFRRGGAGGGLGGFGRAHPRTMTGSTQTTTFDDVAGIDEARAELLEIVDFLRRPERYERIGATTPRGVLLYGPPGTGKTLLARAVAGEASVPFFSLAASEFVEMYVGVGASRVRDLFQQAKKAAPAIVFIDELDAIGRARGPSGRPGANDEREQTLNQILTELDGFTGDDRVIVLAATNRPEILDPALLRAGRFDRRVAVNPPDRAGRLAILRVHTRGVRLAPDADLDRTAAATPGMVGADLRNLVNEAALTAVRRGRDEVGAADLTEALERILLGAERRIVISPDEKRRTAFHEAGHALLGVVQPGADTVRKVSIVPHGQALGVTLQSPEADRYGETSDYLRGRIIGALGGRAAEEVVFGDLTTSAASDLEIATRIARQMVVSWGMSAALGPVVLDYPADAPGEAGGASERTRELVDTEVRRIVESAHEEAVRLLEEHRGALDALAGALLERETLDEADVYRLAGGRPVPRPVIDLRPPDDDPSVPGVVAPPSTP